ncbi:MAG: hypothetical protein JST68_31220 [Bacteroidetes bacterium]|nr:hypothetical protein [Bacteroidota bacterium]
MRKTIILLFCIIPCLLSQAQHDVLVLQKRGMHVRSYTIGDPFIFETVYGQWFSGTIDDLRHDSIYILGQVFSYKEIKSIQRLKKGSAVGKLMMVAGGGFTGISIINGLIRKDPAKEWFTTSGYVIAGALLGGGLALSQMKSKYYHLGRKYRLLYLQIGKR